MNTFSLLLDAPATSQGGALQTLIMVGVAILFFYFILLRPEQKRRKVMQEQRGRMKEGDQVTAMNIVGILDQIREQTVVLRMEDGSKIEVLKMAITDVKSKE